MIFKNKFKYIEYIVLFVLFSLLSVLYLNHQWGILYNSDTMFLTQLIDHLTNGGKYVDWLIPTTPMYFPDWGVFVISYFLSNNIYIRYLIYSILITILLYLSIRLIYSEFYSREKTIVFSLTSISIFLFLATNVISPYVLLLVPVQHAGTFIIGLFYLYIQLKLLNISTKNNNNIYFCCLIILSLIMGVSDLLFIVEFIFPICAIHILMYIKKQISLENLVKFSFIPLTFSVVGVWLLPYVMPKTILWAYLDHPSISKITVQSLSNRFQFIKSCFKGILYSYPIFIYIYLVFFIINIIAFFVYFFNTIDKRLLQIVRTKKIFFICHFFIISIVVNIIAFLLLPNQVSSTPRYIEPIFFIPIALFFIIFSFGKKMDSIMKIITVISLIILGYLTLKNTITISKKIFTIKNYYSKEIQCIDNALKETGRYGISDYWTARPITLFSRKNLIVHAFNENLTPFILLTDISEFKNKYTFAIIHKEFPIEQTLKLYDQNPKKIVICENKKIFIYEKNNLKVPCFIKKGYKFTWQASALPSRFTASAIEKTRVANKIDGENFLSFGPYIVLPKGLYHFYIRYSSENVASEQVGTYDVFNIKNGILFQKPLFGTNNKIINLKGKFFVNSLQEYSIPFEIRVYFLGKGELKLESITLERG